jgi:hypothetical protein
LYEQQLPDKEKAHSKQRKMKKIDNNSSPSLVIDAMASISPTFFEQLLRQFPRAKKINLYLSTEKLLV